jgi:23S rRNA (uracil1939-C5)-methyltransferase
LKKRAPSIFSQSLTNNASINKRRRQKAQQTLGPVQHFTVDGLTHEAKGVARSQGKVTFIAGALPSEIVTAQVIKSNRRYDEAKLLDIQQKSAHRIAPECRHYEQCGGCSFQHLTIEQQRAAKMSWLQGQLRKVCPEQTLTQLTDSPFGYRRRARLAVRVKDQTLHLGFRAKSSQDIVSIDNCLVLTPQLQRIFRQVKAVLKKDTIAEKIGHIELLEDTKGLSVLLRLIATISSAEHHKWQQWAELQQVELYWQMPDEHRANVLPTAMRHYQLEGFNLAYYPQDFIQVNATMNEKMVAQAMDWLTPNQNDVVLDLFCGVGNFSLPIAKRAKQVVGVEVQPSMVAAGQANAKENQLDNLSFIAADLTQPAPKTITSLGVTKVLLDPPRAGAFEFLLTLVKLRPKQILYVSCDAATLARDAEYLVAKGYKVKRAAMMDMFPQTAHLETMLLLAL